MLLLQTRSFTWFAKCFPIPWLLFDVRVARSFLLKIHLAIISHLFMLSIAIVTRKSRPDRMEIHPPFSFAYDLRVKILSL